MSQPIASKQFKRDIPRRRYSGLAAMSIYFCCLHNIYAVAQELNIDSDNMSAYFEDQQDVYTGFVTVLAEVRRVARQMEADRTVTILRAPRLL